MAATPAPAAPPAATAKSPANPLSAEETTLLRGLDKLRNENKLTDVTLIVEEHRFKVRALAWQHMYLGQLKISSIPIPSFISVSTKASQLQRAKSNWNHKYGLRRPYTKFHKHIFENTRVTVGY